MNHLKRSHGSDCQGYSCCVLLLIVTMERKKRQVTRSVSDQLLGGMSLIPKVESKMTHVWDVLLQAMDYTSDEFVLMGMQFSRMEERVYAKYDDGCPA